MTRGGGKVENAPDALYLYTTALIRIYKDQFRVTGNCPPTPSLRKYFALSDK